MFIYQDLFSLYSILIKNALVLNQVVLVVVSGKELLIKLNLQVEIDIGAKVRAVKAVGVATAELKKKSGRIIAQARYSKYIGASSRLKATLPCKL